MISHFLTMGWIYKGNSITELKDMPKVTIGFIYKITNGKYHFNHPEFKDVSDEAIDIVKEKEY